MGTPSSPTTFVSFPSTVVASERWFSVRRGVRHLVRPQGRREADRTRKTKTKPKPSATLFRLRRRSPSFQGPRPGTCSRSASCSKRRAPQGRARLQARSPCGLSCSRRNTTRRGGRSIALPEDSNLGLLEAEARVVVEVDRVEEAAVVEVHPLREERGQLAMAVRRDPTPLEQLRCSGPSTPRSSCVVGLLVQLGDPLVISGSSTFP